MRATFSGATTWRKTPENDEGNFESHTHPIVPSISAFRTKSEVPSQGYDWSILLYARASRKDERLVSFRMIMLDSICHACTLPIDPICSSSDEPDTEDGALDALDEITRQNAKVIGDHYVTMIQSSIYLSLLTLRIHQDHHGHVEHTMSVPSWLPSYLHRYRDIVFRKGRGGSRHAELDIDQIAAVFSKDILEVIASSSGAPETYRYISDLDGKTSPMSLKFSKRSKPINNFEQRTLKIDVRVNASTVQRIPKEIQSLIDDSKPLPEAVADFVRQPYHRSLFRRNGDDVRYIPLSSMATTLSPLSRVKHTFSELKTAKKVCFTLLRKS